MAICCCEILVSSNSDAIYHNFLRRSFFLVFTSDRPYGDRRRGFTQAQKIMYSLTDFEKEDVKGFLS